MLFYFHITKKNHIFAIDCFIVEVVSSIKVILNLLKFKYNHTVNSLHCCGFFISMNTLEIWKDIKGYEGYYQVSNYGRVKSIERTIHQGLTTTLGRKTEMYRTLKEKVLKFSIIAKKYKNGKLKGCYSYALLCKDGIIKRYPVHKLVLTTFEPIQSYETINHKDGNGINNHIDNLEYMSYVDNTQHYLISVGQIIKKVRNNKTGELFPSIRAAAKQHLINRGVKDIKEHSISNACNYIKKTKKYEII